MSASQALALATWADIDVAALDTNIIAADAIAAPVGALAITNIECKVVPWTGHDKAFHAPFT
jgi:hypothetical protein